MKIILFVVLVLDGHSPQPFNTPMDDLESCLIEVHHLLSEPGDEVKQALATGGSLQAGCVLVVPSGSPA